MFWKKKKVNKVDISIDSSDKRDAFRYKFKPNDTLTIQFLETPVTLLNISASGLAFMNKGFKKNQTDLIEFELDIPNYLGNTIIAVMVRIIDIDDRNICRCIFEDCSQSQQDIIHKYLLEIQKTELKTKKPYDPSS